MALDASLEGLKKLVDQSKNVRGRFEPAWFMNLAFYNSDQWVFWNRGRLDRPQIPKHRLLITDNRILPVIETRIAKKTKQRPIWSVTPNSPEDQDIEASELGELVMEDKWKSLCMQEKLVDVLRWADICSAGFWKVCWDKTLGDKATYVVDQEGQPIQGQDGRLMQLKPGQPPPAGLDVKTIAQGDVALEVRSPFQIIPDPLAATLEECEWVIEEVVHSPEWVKSHYGVELEGDSDATPGPADGRYFSTSSSSSLYKGVCVYEFWSKSSSKYPKGKHVVWAKSQILKDGDNPYECLPYVMFKGVPTPGRFWPESIVNALRGPQIELNKVKSQIAENGQRIGNPSLLRNRISNVSYSGVPGEIVDYDDNTQNAKPGFLEPPSMPTYVIEQQDRIEMSMREISGQHEVTAAQVPAGVTAASAINLLLEQDDTRLGPAVYELEEALGRSGQMILKLVAEYYTDERTLRLAGEDGDWDIEAFKGDMLRNNVSIEVQAGSAFPLSKAAKQAAMTNMLTLFVQNGIPLDPRTLRKFFKDFQVGGLDTLFDDLTSDTRQVKRENRAMYAGTPVRITSVDDDEFHIAEHSEEMKSSRYARRVREQQMVGAIFEKHLADHKARARQNALVQQQEDMQRQVATQNAVETHSTQDEATLSDQSHQQKMDELQRQLEFDQWKTNLEASLEVKKIEAQRQAAQAQAQAAATAAKQRPAPGQRPQPPRR